MLGTPRNELDLTRYVPPGIALVIRRGNGDIEYIGEGREVTREEMEHGEVYPVGSPALNQLIAGADVPIRRERKTQFFDDWSRPLNLKEAATIAAFLVAILVLLFLLPIKEWSEAYSAWTRSQ
ncbi:MAG: hypothetical protein KW793_02530 [Candidatus Doudnabacteria bacterium]|nr:hypothetical protein [Candidatus Doudnabacteria bacterium]